MALDDSWPFLVAACGARAWHGLKRRQLKKILFSRETHAGFFFHATHARPPSGP